MEKTKGIPKMMHIWIVLVWLIAFILSIQEARESCLSLFLLNFPLMLLNLLGCIPLIGPLFVYLGGKALLDSAQLWMGLHAPMTTGFMLWTSVLTSMLYCILSSMTVTAIILAKKLKKKVNKESD